MDNLNNNSKTTENKIAIPQDMVLCRWCKNPIMKKDSLCKHCGESQKEEKISLKIPTLSFSDCILVLFLQLIGIIAGIVHISNGEKSRGFALIKYSIAAIIISTIVAASILYPMRTLIKIIGMS